ncbi:MAG TPA: Ig-like domain-containing protein [Dehalococcoidia bacterium]|nr:Ig-like domain-containing protein [Dehalococcoidia bacterium]
MASRNPARRLINGIGGRWRGLSTIRRAILGLGVTAALAVGLGAGFVLFRGSASECTPQFCAQVLGPSGDDVDPMTPVRIRLHGIDEDAALAALTISNDAKGNAKFEDGVLVFRPEWPGFARGVTYDVRLKLPPASTSNREVDLGTRFTVGGKLAVAIVLPSDGTREVAADAEIFVQFNRSVAPLTVLAASLPQDVLSFDPPVEGKGRWLNTSLYVFDPIGWEPSTAYTGRVKAGLTSRLGAQLDADHIFRFETVTPAVLAVEPVNNSKFVMPQPEIRVEFNQRVDRASAEQRFSLSQFGQPAAPVPGSFEWSNDAGFVFRPYAPLNLAVNYEAVVGAGVRALGAQAATGADHRWSFGTVEAPRVKTTTPKNGETSAQPYSLQITFATPMEPKSVEDNLVIEPKPTGDILPVNSDPSGLNFYIGARLANSTSYRVTLSTEAKDRNGINLSEPLELSFTTMKMQPTARMFRSGQVGTFNAYLDPTVMVTSWNVDKLDFKLYRLSQDEFIARLNGPRNALPDSALLRTWSLEITDPGLDKAVVSQVRLDSNGPRLMEGFYVVVMETPGVAGQGNPYAVYGPSGRPMGDELPIVISSANLTTKWTNEDLLIWALDMQTGLPFTGWRFDVLDNKGKQLARGTTGDDGVAKIDLKGPGNNYYPGYYVVAKKDDRVFFAGTNWSEGISPYNYGSGISTQFQLPPLVGHSFTDRPIYRPGETVYLKGVVRSDDDAKYSLPEGLQLDVTITDDRGRKIDTQKVTLSDFGTFDISLALAQDASPGVYNARVSDPGNTQQQNLYGPSITSVSFRVAEFVKPEFEVTVKTDKDSYVNGETINATVSANLYFGAPLADAELRWQVTGSRYSYRNETFSRFQTGEYRVSFGCMVSSVFEYEPQRFFRQEGRGRTDAEGKFYFSVPADVAGDIFSQQFTVEAYVTDEKQQQVAEFTNIPVHKGRFYIGVQPQEYSPKAGKATKINLATIDPLSNKTAPNVSMEVGVFERKWRTVRERAADGQQVYKSVSEDIPVETLSARTGADGLGSFNVTLPRSGQFYIKVSAKDDLANVIQSSMVLWASGNEFASWHIPNDDRFTLVADKEEYKPGETARILVAAPFEGASIALVSQERGKVLAYETRRIAGNSEVLELPIVASHVPNFYLSVTLFKPPTAENPMPQVKFGLVQIRVSNDEKKLNIALEPNAKRLNPRDSVTYTVRTTDNNGRGVPAEVSLALVDKAVLSLQDDFARPSIEAFWSRRPLSVITASSFTYSVDRANELAKAMYPGGKGGGGALTDETRREFPNTAYWEPSLKTDANGRATVEVKLPDSMTTWRLTARGVTGDTKTGEGRNEIVVSRDLILRPDLPRFLNTGDDARVGAIVNNLTEAPVEVAVSIAAQGIEVAGEPTQTITVAPGRSTPVRWALKAAPGSNEAAFTFSANASTATDAVELKIPLHAYFTPETVATAGDLTAKATEAIEVPSYVLPDAGGLTVNVTPSIMAGVQTGYRYLKEYPYESAEATVSRFVAALAIERAVKELKLTDVDPLVEDTRPLIQRSLQKLYETQQQDGGWGWWRAEASDPMMTAYVLVGLGEAKRAGYMVDGGADLRAATFLTGELNKPRDAMRPDFDLRAFMLYALARDKRGDLSRTYALAEQRANLSNTAKAWAAEALKLSGSPDNDPRLTSLLTDLQSAAMASATGTHWEETTYNRRVFGSSTTTTTQVLQTLTALQPQNPLVDGAVRWLMLERKEGRWQTSYNTATALLAITDVMLARHDVQQTFDYRVVLNGDTKLEGQAEKGKVHQEDSVVVDMSRLTKGALNDLLISRSPAGDSRLYYTAQLRYYTPATDIEASSQGLGVSHQYFRAEGDDTVPVNSMQLGDLVKVKVTLVAPSDLNYLVLEDYLPAGLEPVDGTLKITPLDIRRRMAEEARKAYQVNKRYSPFSEADVHDNRVALFASFVPRGVYEYTYFARATTAGSFHLPPATAHEQYFPEVFGRSDGGLFIVREATE